MSERLLLIINRYRTYDRLMYEVLAEAFDLAVIWISPPPANEPLPVELASRLQPHVVDRDDRILRARDVQRNLELFQLIRREGRDRDLIIASTSDSWKARVAFAAARSIGVPIAMRKERWYDPAVKRGLRRAYRVFQERTTDFLERHATGVLVGGSQAEQYVVDRGTSPERVMPFRYLHPDLGTSYLDATTVDELKRLKGNRIAFLYLGRVMPQKGLATLIAAFRWVLDSGRDAVLFVVGAPITRDEGRGKVSAEYFEQCQTLARGESRVMFFPAANPERVQDFYAASDVFVHPHVKQVNGVEVRDGWGNVITEAASMSLPIISTDRVASAFDLIENDRNGFLLASSNLDDELVTAITRLVDHPELLPAFGRYSRQRFEQFVDPATNVASIKQLIEMETASRSGRRARPM
ncbi:MAG: glycosyltransferase family 4 protein [Rhodoglobus sp.]